MTTPTRTRQDPRSPILSTDVNQQGLTLAKRSANSRKTSVGLDIRKIPRQTQKDITKFFSELQTREVNRYIQDWERIRPKTNQETINRWRFAYCTIHTPWERSCNQYNQVKGIYGKANLDSLERLLSRSTGGMWSIKANGIYHFQLEWATNKQLFEPTNDWQTWRNKLVEALPGIGQAKVSFAIEMIHPTEAECICLDRHMLKAFGWTQLDKQPELDQYMIYEDYWLKLSAERGVPPVISRNIFWDRIQKQDSSLYWAQSIID